MITSIIKYIKMKKFIHFSFLSLFFLFLVSISANSQNTECFNSTITYHNKDYPAQFFESATAIDDSTDFAKYKSGYFKVDSNCIIQYIDLKHLHDMVKKSSNNVLIFFWSSFDGDSVNFSKLYELQKNKIL